MTSIYFLRHGESEMNTRLAEIVSGRSNHTPLTKKGYAQAHTAGLWLALHGIRPTVAISSPAVRTTETMATCLAAMNLSLTVEIDDRIQEITHGEMEGEPRAEVWNETRRAALFDDPMHYALPGGESLRDVQARKLDWVDDICRRHPNSTILVAGHGIAISSLVGHLHNWKHIQIAKESRAPNCSLTHISHDNNEFAVHYLGRDIVTEMNDVAQ